MLVIQWSTRHFLPPKIFSGKIKDIKAELHFQHKNKKKLRIKTGAPINRDDFVSAGELYRSKGYFTILQLYSEDWVPYLGNQSCVFPTARRCTLSTFKLTMCMRGLEFYKDDLVILLQRALMRTSVSMRWRLSDFTSVSLATCLGASSNISVLEGRVYVLLVCMAGDWYVLKAIPFSKLNSKYFFQLLKC